MSNKIRKSNDIIRLRDDVYVYKENIDCIVKTNIDPKDKSNLKEDIYVIYLKNSHFNWISLTKEQYNKYLKHLI